MTFKEWWARKTQGQSNHAIRTLGVYKDTLQEIWDAAQAELMSQKVVAAPDLIELPTFCLIDEGCWINTELSVYKDFRFDVPISQAVFEYYAKEQEYWGRPEGHAVPWPGIDKSDSWRWSDLDF